MTPATRKSIPYAAKNNASRITSFFVMNPESYDTINITTTYYNTLGGIDLVVISAVNGYGGLAVSQANVGSLPDGWEGSILLQSPNPFVAVLRNTIGSGTTYDFATINGSIR